MAKGETIEPVNNEVNVDHDALIGEISQRISEEYARGSDASESGAKTKDFLEKTNLNSQVFSGAKTILKKLPKKDGQAKAMDMIRSWFAVLPMLEAHVTGQGTAEMALEEPEDADEKEVDPAMGKPTTDVLSPDDGEDGGEGDPADFIDEDLDEDAADFTDAVADLDGDEGDGEDETSNVEPFEREDA